MEGRAFEVSSPKNSKIAIKVIPGHFTTSNSHISHYLNMSSLKSNASVAKGVAQELALPYLTSTLVDTIVCMEETEVIGAYLAQALVQDGMLAMNKGREIHVITPMSNVSGKLIFHSSAQEMIWHRNILLLVASVSSGSTIHRALECLTYYGGTLVGISALFNAKSGNVKQEIHSLFTSADIVDFHSYQPTDCIMCKEGYKLDAIVNSEGYTKL